MELLALFFATMIACGLLGWILGAATTRRIVRPDTGPACANCGARGVELVGGVDFGPGGLVCLPCLYPEGY